MTTSLLPRRGLAALAVALTLGAGAMTSCGATESSPAGQTASPVAATAGDPFGPECTKVPANGGGSLNGMAAAPVATAAGANPLLSSLAALVTKAGLVDTLNSADGITVFAPANDAFAKIPAKQLSHLSTHQRLLTTILKHHIIAGQLMPDQLAGSHRTLAGDTLRITGSRPDFRVGPEKARILCGDVQTANATVYIIDTVLSPSK